MPPVPKIVLATLGLGLAPGVFADVCRWTDAQGRTHYAETAPPGVTCARTLKTPPPATAPGAPPTAAGRPYQELEAEFQRRRVQRAEAERDAAVAKKKAEQMKEECNAVRGRLTWIQNGGRMARIDANGERHIYNEEDIARETAMLQQRAAQLCVAQ